MTGMDGFHLLDPGRARPGIPGSLADLLRGTGPGRRGPRIRCPLCRWHPAPSDRWACRCGEVWNTFETRGLCPRCAHQWTRTACLSCHQWSRHEDWYERGTDPGPDPGASP